MNNDLWAQGASYPTFTLIAEQGPLALSTYNLLQTKGLSVNIYAEKVRDWKRKLASGDQEAKMVYKMRVKAPLGEKVVFISSLFTPTSKPLQAVEKDTVALSTMFSQDLDTRRVSLLFPRKTESGLNEKLKELVEKYAGNACARTVLVESLFDPSLLPNKFDPLYAALDNLSNGLSPRLQTLRATDPDGVSKEVVNSMLSLSFDRAPLSIVGPKITTSVLVDKKLSQLEGVQKKYVFFATAKKQKVAGPTQAQLQALITRRAIEAKDERTDLQPKQKPKKPRKRKKTSFFRGVFIFLFLFIFLEVVLFSTGVGGILFARKQIERGSFSTAQTAAGISTSAISTARLPLRLLTATPFLEKLFEPLDNAFSFTLRTLHFWNGLLQSTAQTSSIVEMVLGNEKYSIENSAKNQALYFDQAIRDIGFIKAQSQQGKLEEHVFNAFFLDLAKLKDTLVAARQLMLAVPELLGSDSPKTYAVLIQDNTTLRPTGGVVRYVVLLKFDSGKLVDMSYVSASAIQEGLRGFVQPPSELQDLGISNWGFDNANWRANFVESAERVEWFLDKGVAQSVDGVVALDLFALFKLASLTGPVNTSLADEQITADNLVLQVAKSQKKEELVGEVTKILFDEAIANKGFGQRGLWWLLSMFTQSHAMAFLHLQSAQGALADIGFTGDIYKTWCDGENCFDDGLVFSETTLSQNGNAQLVKRSAALDILIENGIVKRKLTMDFLNQSNLDYKGYFKVYADQKAKFAEAVIREGNSQYNQVVKTSSTAGIVEGALPISVAKDGLTRVVLVWHSPADLNFGSKGAYNFYLRMHSGYENLYTKTNFSFPRKVEAVLDQALTQSATIGYNTLLLQDEVLHFSW